MNSFARMLIATVLVTTAFAQTPEPPLSDKRLSVHTLVREDIFAGYLLDDMNQFSRGERNIDILLEQRPESREALLAWKAGANLYRAVRAHENNQPAEFEKYYKKALDIFAEAMAKNPEQPDVAAVRGGSFALLGDRLPEEYRQTAFSDAYESYKVLWKFQGNFVSRLPVHLRGELLGGLALSSRRIGRTEETNAYLDKIIELMRDTPYEPAAKQWKKNPASAASVSITCLTCHDDGRLAARLNALNQK